jgi:diguanylate cyclase (GGDEF)-like protein
MPVHQKANETTQYGAASPAVSAFAPGPKPDSPPRLRTVALENEDLKQALATSQTQTQAARKVIRKLAERNAHLVAEVARLEQEEAKARSFAFYDELTGLPNRRLLRDRLLQGIAQCARQDSRLALLFVDLDGFKSVNDRLGHAAGDQLLQLVAERLTASIRATDTASRYGGDEFVIIIQAVAHPALFAVARAVTEKLRLRLADPFIVGGFKIRISASVGTAFYPDHGSAFEELMQKADAALYRAKASCGKASIMAL